MSNIFDLPSGWRNQLMPASLNNARFHCEANSRESGRRIVEHEFPKKDLPYAEDMGRHAREFSIRAYCIAFPYDGDQLYQQDYRKPRDAMIAVLESEGPHTLQLPTQASQQVVCLRYRLTEEERFGGYCTIDMTFLEYGLDPQIFAPDINTATAIEEAGDVLRGQVLRSLQPPEPPPATVPQ